MIATRGFLAALECTRFDFGLGSAPDPAGEAYNAPPDPLAGLRGPISKGKERGGEKERGKQGKGRKRKGEGGTVNRRDCPLMQISCFPPKPLAPKQNVK